MKSYIISVLSVFITYVASANVRIPNFFGDSMVLQRSKPIPIWGWADKGEKIIIKFNNQVRTTRAGKDGTWRLELNPEDAGGPYQLVVQGKNTINVKDVLVGDVWVCSGQSNMEFAVSSSENALEEIKQANYPNIRHIEIPKAMSHVPKHDLERAASWKPATSQHVGRFSAVGYFYARELQKELGIPIGLIHTSWGGTDIETWISRSALEESDMFKGKVALPGRADNLETLIKERKKQIMEKLESLQGGFPDAASLEKWKMITFDDSQWPQISIPGLWEQSIENFDGVVWLRKTIDIKAEDAGKPGLLELARIDDSDETYVNGIRIGGLKDSYNDMRRYPISAGLLKQGKNVIAVRIEDNGGGGGIYGAPEEVRITVDNKIIPLASKWRYQVEAIFENSSSNTGNIGNPNDYPTLLFNAMVHPLTGFAIKGVIWYQGENNANRAFQYRTTFPLMINDWRKHWKQGDFPFYFVQLASWKASNGNSVNGSTWAELREAQTLTSSLPNTGMAVTVDIGDTNDIHPKNKQDVGKRLSAIALNNTYGKNITFSGPSFASLKLEAGKARLGFQHIGEGLVARDKYGYLKGFEISGVDQKFYYAKATIAGNEVIVSHPDVPNPVAVRYAWADDAGDVNLYNKDGFPAVPFRTDQWKSITEFVKYNIR